MKAPQSPRLYKSMRSFYGPLGSSYRPSESSYKTSKSTDRSLRDHWTPESTDRTETSMVSVPSRYPLPPQSSIRTPNGPSGCSIRTPNKQFSRPRVGECRLCGKRFTTGKSLFNHLDYDHPQRGRQKCTIDSCKYSTTLYRRYKNHLTEVHSIIDVWRC